MQKQNGLNKKYEGFTSYKYKAFISYKHSEKGRKHAIAIERGLKQYAKPLFRRPTKIFRDEKHMVPHNDLGKLITDGLEQSEYLIFIAEKGAADSTWCQEELEYWCKTLGRKDKLILIHIDDSISLDFNNKKIDWDKTDALPSLLSLYIPSIPFYVDLHWAQEPEELVLGNLNYKSIINLVAAKLRGVTPEELNDEELRVYRRNRRLRNWAIGVLSGMLLISILTSIFAFLKQREAFVSAEKAEVSATKAKINADLATKSAQEARDSATVAQEQRMLAQQQQIIAENQTKIAEQKAIEAKANLVRYKKSLATYLTEEAENAFEKEDVRLALLLGKEAVKNDQNNKDAKALLTKLNTFYSDYYIGTKEFTISKDSSFIALSMSEEDSNSVVIIDLKKRYPPRKFQSGNNFKFSPSSNFFCFYSKGIKGSFDVVNILDLKSMDPPRRFEDTNDYFSTNVFSPDSKYFNFISKGEVPKFRQIMINKEYHILNTVDLERNDPPKKIQYVFNQYKTTYNSNSRYMIFFTFESSPEDLTLNLIDLHNSKRSKKFENVNLKSPSFISNDRYLTFFTLSENKNYDILNVLELEKNLEPRKFRNVDIDSDFESPNGKYLSFFSKEKSETTYTLEVLNLESNTLPKKFNDVSLDSERYSPDGKYLSFYTKGQDENYTTLNILDLQKNTLLNRYENVKLESQRFSPDSRFLNFLKKDKNEEFNFLNIVDLTGEQATRFYGNSRLSSSFERINNYSPNGRYFFFFTEAKGGKYTTLNLLDLYKNIFPTRIKDANGRKFIYSSNSKYLAYTTKNQYTGRFLNVINLERNATEFYSIHNNEEFAYGPNNKFIVFLDEGKDNSSSILKIVNLQDDAYVKKDENYYKTPFRKNFQLSSDGKYVGYLTKNQNEDHFSFNILNLDVGKIERKVSHLYHPHNIQYIRQNQFMTIATHPINQNRIYKIIDLNISNKQQITKYYKGNLYSPLTIQEKEKYGIVD